MGYLVFVTEEVAVHRGAAGSGGGNRAHKPQTTLIALQPKLLVGLLDSRLQAAFSSRKVPPNADVPHARKGILAVIAEDTSHDGKWGGGAMNNAGAPFDANDEGGISQDTGRTAEQESALYEHMFEEQREAAIHLPCGVRIIANRIRDSTTRLLL